MRDALWVRAAALLEEGGGGPAFLRPRLQARAPDGKAPLHGRVEFDVRLVRF